MYRIAKREILFPEETMKIRTVYEPLYQAEVDLVTNCTVKELAERYSRHNEFLNSPAVGKTCRLSKDDDPTYEKFLVWIKDRKSHETMCHEAVHLANLIFKTRGVVVEFEDKKEGVADEHQAYYVGFWFKQMMEKL